MTWQNNIGVMGGVSVGNGIYAYNVIDTGPANKPPQTSVQMIKLPLAASRTIVEMGEAASVYHELKAKRARLNEQIDALCAARQEELEKLRAEADIGKIGEWSYEIERLMNDANETYDKIGASHRRYWAARRHFADLLVEAGTLPKIDE